MKSTLPLLLAVSLCGCAAVPEVRLSDEERKNCLRAEDPTSGIIMLSAYGVGCLEYGPAKRMKGVWYYGFEESGFLKDVRIVPLARDFDDENPEQDVHLTFSDRAEVAKIDVGERKRACVRAIYLEIIGRKAVRRFPRALSREIDVLRVDRVLTSKFIGHVKTTIGGKPYMMCE